MTIGSFRPELTKDWPVNSVRGKIACLFVAQADQARLPSSFMLPALPPIKLIFKSRFQDFNFPSMFRTGSPVCVFPLLKAFKDRFFSKNK